MFARKKLTNELYRASIEKCCVKERKFLADAARLADDISSNQTFATVRPLLNIWAAFTPSHDVCANCRAVISALTSQ